jgi:hypothetical protein
MGLRRRLVLAVEARGVNSANAADLDRLMLDLLDLHDAAVRRPTARRG